MNPKNEFVGMGTRGRKQSKRKLEHRHMSQAARIRANKSNRKKA